MVPFWHYNLKKIAKGSLVSSIKVLVFAAAALTLTACSAPKSNSVVLTPSDSIIGGEDVVAGSEINTSIVGIYDHKIGAICTASLLPDNVVLTAAHCLGDDPSKMFIVFAADMFKILESQDETVVRNAVRQVTSFKAHPFWNPLVEGTSKQWEWNDIALIKFKGNVPAGYKPATFLADAKALSTGNTVTLAGYGVSQVKINKVDPKTIEDLDKAIEEGDVMCSPNKVNCVRMESSGDGVLRSVEVKIAQNMPTEVVVDQRRGKGSCSGDSGGPAYVVKDDKFYLWGITSRGDASCDVNGIYTNALTYLDWIAKASANMK